MHREQKAMQLFELENVAAVDFNEDGAHRHLFGGFLIQLWLKKGPLFYGYN